MPSSQELTEAEPRPLPSPEERPRRPGKGPRSRAGPPALASAARARYSAWCVERLPPPPLALRALPNAISLARLACALLLPFAPRSWWLALVVFAGASDCIDGWIARRFRAASWFGGFLDGFTDKAFVVTALVAFAAHGLLEPWQIPLLLVRDVCVAAGYGISAARRDTDAFRDMDPRAFGKLTTSLIFLLLAALLVWPDAHWLHDFLHSAAAITSIAAGIDYVRTRFRRVTGRT